MGSEAAGPPTFVVYSRPGCHLCEHLVEALMPLLRGRAAVAIRNIDSDRNWHQRFATRIPVVECGGTVVCEGRLDPAAIEAAFGACAGGDQAGRPGPVDSPADREA